MGVPLLDLKAHHEPLHQEIMAAMEQIFQSQAFILGPEVENLEEHVAAYCQAKYGIGVTSGTDALLIALMALDLPALERPAKATSAPWSGGNCGGAATLSMKLTWGNRLTGPPPGRLRTPTPGRPRPLRPAPLPQPVPSCSLRGDNPE